MDTTTYDKDSDVLITKMRHISSYPEDYPSWLYPAVGAATGVLLIFCIGICVWKILLSRKSSQAKLSIANAFRPGVNRNPIDFIVPISPTFSDSDLESGAQVEPSRLAQRRFSLAGRALNLSQEVISEEERRSSQETDYNNPVPQKPIVAALAGRRQSGINLENYLGHRRASSTGLGGGSSTPGSAPGPQTPRQYMRRGSSSGFLPRRGSMSTFEIQPDELAVHLYNPGSDSADEYHMTPTSALGKVCFSLAYDRSIERLSVELIRAVHLSCKQLKETADPYVKLFLLPDKKPKFISKIKRGTTSPIFEETFYFFIKPDDIKSRTLRMVVCDYDRFSRQVVIGYISFPLKDVDLLAVDKTDDIWREVTEDIPRQLYRGEVLLTLCFDSHVGSLTVGIIKAKELQPPEAERETAGTYFKVSLTVAERVIKAKRTKTHRKTHNPVFNEEFVMTVQPSLVNQVSIMVCACTRSGLGSSRLIGKTLVGPFMYATGQGFEHWRDMLSSPRTPVAKWHVLS
ncbi:synaptotagmin-7 [Lingula anatina]|uniref:Synaptotagmin-7 n=1 Tax=Lingula anatina TaxID=7574 RepID=A0A1S3HMM2_LINAN|nr:synaptotagmin-7 [Lingula anatina]|eukprot:XP_013386304.1 synaptotagmin-7 [Lingula anatina]